MNGRQGEEAVYAVAFSPGAADPLGDPRRLFAMPADALDLSPAADHERVLAVIHCLPPCIGDAE